MSEQVYFIEQMVNKQDENSYWFYKWLCFDNLNDVRSASEKTAKYHRPVAYFIVKLKPTHETTATN